MTERVRPYVAVLSGVLGATFLSRADVREWPVFGGVAQAVGCVFVERDAPRARVRAARELLRRVRTMGVVVFPEGTTTGAVTPGVFVPGLFRLLRRVAVPVIPVTLRYDDRRAYWVEDVSMWDHLRTRVLVGPGLTCTVHIGAPLETAACADDEALAAAAHRAVSQPIEALGELCAANGAHPSARTGVPS